MTTIGDPTPYLMLIAPEHQSAPNFMAMCQVDFQDIADIMAVIASMPGLFDLDVAVGQQLDWVGERVGISRQLPEPLTGVYFVLDGYPGLDQGTLEGPFDPSTGLVSVPDEQYRTMIRAKIASNVWDGTVPGGEAVLSIVFPDSIVFIQDNQDMSITLGIASGPALDAVTYALFTGGYFDLRPAGVQIKAYVTSSVPGSPIFGLDADNDVIGGLDHGAFATIVEGS